MSNLEKSPTETVPPSEAFLIPKPGTVDWNLAAEDHKTLYENSMEGLRKCVKQKRMLIEPCFRDFDHHNNHHISRQQFQQCLAIMNLPFSRAEIDAIEARFNDDLGVNYMKFLHELLPDEYKSITPRYFELKKEILGLNDCKKLPELDSATDLEGVLFKIKNKVFKERFRLIDYMKDYDKLNAGRILKNHFQRALGLSPLQLAGTEIAILEDRYQSNNNPEYVDYRVFCEEVESIFTIQHLDKNPRREVQQFHPVPEWEANTLTKEEEDMFVQAMNRITNKVRQHRMQLFPLMEDYDIVNNGTLSRSQFRRVLVELELGSYFTERELQTVYKKFNVRIGTRDDVQYTAFCDAVYELAGFVYRKP